jgi:hypothetical protein
MREDALRATALVEVIVDERDAQAGARYSRTPRGKINATIECCR